MNRPTAKHLYLAALCSALPKKARVVVPESDVFDWDDVFKSSHTPITFTDTIRLAARMCEFGQPAIAVLGLSKGKLIKALRRINRDIGVTDTSTAR